MYKRTEVHKKFKDAMWERRKTEQVKALRDRRFHRPDEQSDDAIEEIVLKERKRVEGTGKWE